MRLGKCFAVTAALALAAGTALAQQALVTVKKVETKVGRAEEGDSAKVSGSVVITTTRPSGKVTRAFVVKPGDYTFIRPGEGWQAFSMPAKKEKATFLGVTTRLPSQTLQKQLSLPAGVGLVVEHVCPASPAKAAGIEKHDVLHKLEDQLLINAHQFAVLVRMHKPGEQIELTVIRQGKPRRVKAKLAEKELPVLRPGGVGVAPGFTVGRGGVGRRAPFGVTVGPAGVITKRKIAMADGEHTLTLTSEGDGKEHLEVRDKDGKVVFDGPINTPEERKEVPEDIRKKLDKIEKSVRVQLRSLKVQQQRQ